MDSLNDIFLNEFVGMVGTALGLAVPISIGSGGTHVDLTPLIEGLDKLHEQGERLFGAITHPAETAGAEKCEYAVRALHHGLYDDAIIEARASIEIYRYRPSAWLVGALAAIALSRGEEAATWLHNAVKYSGMNEPEAGAIAAIIGANLCDAAGATELSTAFLRDGDTAVGGTCPELLVALEWRIEDEAEGITARLYELFLDDPSLDVYESASPRFILLCAGTEELLESYVSINEACHESMRAVGNIKRRAALHKGPVRTAIKDCGGPNLRFTDTSIAHWLDRCHDLPGAPERLDQKAAEQGLSEAAAMNANPKTPLERCPYRHIVRDRLVIRNYDVWASRRIATALGKLMVAGNKSLTVKSDFMMEEARKCARSMRPNFEELEAEWMKAPLDELEDIVEKMYETFPDRPLRPVLRLNVDFPLALSSPST